MIEKNQKREREKHKPTARDYIVLALYILGVVGLGLLVINQYLEFRYKVVWLGDPCGLCSDLNPHLDKCIKDASVVTQEIKGNKIEEINLSNLNLRLTDP